LARSAYLATTIAGFSSATAGCDDAGKDLPAVTKASAGLSATGDVCMQTLWQADGNSSRLNCTANDVGIAEVPPEDICVIDPQTDQCKTGEDRNRCNEGETFTFEATFTVELTAQTRYDIGLYFDTGGDTGNDGARGGTCTLNTIDSSNSSSPVNLDGAPDVCGDINDPNNPQLVTLRVTTLCTPGNEEGEVALPNCTSWRQPGSNEVCTQAEDAFPGSPSKCNCDDDFTIPILVEQPAVTMTKRAVSACVYFDVSINNPTSTRTLTFDSLADSLYGDLLQAAGTGTGQNPNLCANTCNLADDDTLAPGETFDCQFGGWATGRDDVQDNTVTANFTDERDQTGTGDASWSFVVDLDPNVVNP
jgi:hypothetical protein